MAMETGKLFIGGISWDTNEDSLKEYFQTFGEVVEAVIMKDRATGRARGFGFVVFADAAVAERVVKAKHMIDGRTVEAKKAVPRDDQQTPTRISGSIQGSPSPARTARTKKIFVGGLASTVTENEFKKYFDQFGCITDVVVMYDHNTQRPRGFGFITFDSEEAVDRVLLRTFHELNGKMVEVKRAVPKELSPGSIKNQLGGPNYGVSRVSDLLSAYTQRFNQSPIGSYGLRLDGRFSPVSVGRSVYPPIGSGYGIGPNLEPGFGSNFEGAGQLSNISYGRGPNPMQNGSPNRFSSAVGYGVGSSGYGISSISRNTLGNGSVTYAKSPTNSGPFTGTGVGNTGLLSAFGNIEAIWGSPPISVQGGGMASALSSGGSLNFDSADSSLELGPIGYARNTSSNVAPTSSMYAAAASSNEGDFGNFPGGGLFYGDPAWRSSSPELDGFGLFASELRNAVSDVTPRDAVHYAEGYSVNNRSTRGMAA
ncbi:heterogeneous nuclear ribonucleoprotein 1 [Daucus carota subsp. sativus]|uniref:heterogeneous nuclear ribonucleoprotein 1 n=1 Tax=Daucus carota subsp. sativus TaxID=79200 RepID=UPI0007EFADB9|nr:PREDICTED: heterogeneous nuclear ribonucleoprotein 1-like [Daucus carota subsp. sativus]XP_017227252.1 PREDICTED: heterogeneous nuclear ribonucleoprotein 1-like [Daucus carota subsp. sativus]